MLFRLMLVFFLSFTGMARGFGRHTQRPALESWLQRLWSWSSFVSSRLRRLVEHPRSNPRDNTRMCIHKPAAESAYSSFYGMLGNFKVCLRSIIPALDSAPIKTTVRIPPDTVVRNYLPRWQQPMYPNKSPTQSHSESRSTSLVDIEIWKRESIQYSLQPSRLRQCIWLFSVSGPRISEGGRRRCSIWWVTRL